MGNKIQEEQGCIDIIINNAVSYSNIRKVNDKELELTMTVNYIAQVLLTEKLLSLVNENSGKIINVASAAQQDIDFSDFMIEKHYAAYSAYSKSKTALIMYTMDLAKILEKKYFSECPTSCYSYEHQYSTERLFHKFC